MAKLKLNKTDKTRLAELVDTYLRIDSEYKIEDNGSVTAKIKDKQIKWLFGLGEVRDFHEITLNMIQKIMEQKASIINVQAFCSDAMSHLMTDNNRSAVIKALYMAHLTERKEDEDEDQSPPRRKERRQSRPLEVEIEVEHEPHGGPHTMRILQGMASSGDEIARILNNSSCIVLNER